MQSKGGSEQSCQIAQIARKLNTFGMVFSTRVIHLSIEVVMNSRSMSIRQESRAIVLLSLNSDAYQPLMKRFEAQLWNTARKACINSH